MKSLQQMIGADRPLEETVLDTEINVSRGAGVLRGVKRRCLGVDAGEMEGRGRSFLETKWEGEVRRRRKLPTRYTPPLVDGSQPESDCETGQESSTSDIEADLTQDSIEMDESVDIEPNSPIAFNQDTAYPEMLHGMSSCQEVESEESDIDVQPRDDQSSLNTASEVSKEISEEGSETTMDQSEPEKETAPAQEITSAQQESTLVRSALRSSLDGEDAELLNNFLTKARAKRAAKAAMQENVVEEVTKEEQIPDMPTPRSRRALEELDTNSPSPSPQKVRLPSPKKPENPPASPIRKEIANDDEEQTGDEKQQSSPVTRRSTRVRVPPRTTTTAIRNTLSLRRAKGTEFVFLQRTEAQELALATRKNTRQNKGSAVFPKYVLKNLAQKQSKEGSPNPVPSANKKGNRVCWNDARLVEFEDGEEPQAAPTEREPSHEPSDVDSAQPIKKGSEKRKTTGGSSGRTRSQRAQKGNETTPSTGTLAPPKTTATPPAGRVRKLGGSATPTKPKSASSPATSSSKSTTDTPAGKRKKLTPKSPSLLSPAKNTSSAPTTTTPASKVPKPTSRASTTSAAKSKSIFKANAGSTPMPKRVRARA